MKKVEKYIFIACGVMIVILWILSSTDLILKEEIEEVYRISVIVNDSEEENWEYFQRGMEYAADQYHVETNFITLYDGISQRKQNEAIAREAEGDAQILIVCPVNAQEFQEFLVENSLKEKPILTLKRKVQSDKVIASIRSDETERGKMLGEMIAEDAKEEETVWIGINNQKQEMYQEFCESLQETLQSYGIESNLSVWNEEEELEDVLERQETIFVGADTDTTKLLAEKKQETDEEKIYGNGINASIVHNLENGRINGIAVVDETSMGCLTIANAVKLLQGDKITDLMIDQYAIPSSEVYSKQYEQVLFPIS